MKFHRHCCFWIRLLQKQNHGGKHNVQKGGCLSMSRWVLAQCSCNKRTSDNSAPRVCKMLPFGILTCKQTLYLSITFFFNNHGSKHLRLLWQFSFLSQKFFFTREFKASESCIQQRTREELLLKRNIQHVEFAQAMLESKTNPSMSETHWHMSMRQEKISILCSPERKITFQKWLQMECLYFFAGAMPVIISRYDMRTIDKVSHVRNWLPKWLRSHPCNRNPWTNETLT